LHSTANELNFGDGITAVQIRIARPTDRLDAVVAFYRDVLGLPELYRFAGHDGYHGVMIGLPGRTYHLEFTTHRNGSDGTSPSRDYLLVFYVPDAGQLARARQRLEALGHRWVTPESPYWIDKSVTFEDPDGWRIVLCQTAGI